MDLYSNLSNAGSSSGNLVVDGTGPELSIRGIIGNGFVNAGIIGNDVQISLDANLTNASFIFSNNVPDGFPNGSTLTAGNGIIITTIGNITTVNSNVSLSSVGTGSIDLVVDGIGSDLTIQSLNAGNGITLSSNSNTVTISSNANSIQLISYIVSNSSPLSGSATIYTTIPSMEITPISGTYIVSFSGSADSDTNSMDKVDYAIFKNSTIVSDSERNFGYSTGNNNRRVRSTIETQTIISANGLETISTKYRIIPFAVFGAFKIYNRNMILLKIG